MYPYTQSIAGTFVYGIIMRMKPIIYIWAKLYNHICSIVVCIAYIKKLNTISCHRHHKIFSLFEGIVTSPEE